MRHGPRTSKFSTSNSDGGLARISHRQARYDHPLALRGEKCGLAPLQDRVAEADAKVARHDHTLDPQQKAIEEFPNG